MTRDSRRGGCGRGLARRPTLSGQQQAENWLERDAWARAAKARLLVQNAKLEMLTLHRHGEAGSCENPAALKSKKNQETFDNADRLPATAPAAARPTSPRRRSRGNLIALQLQDEYQTVTTPRLWKKDDKMITGAGAGAQAEPGRGPDRRRRLRPGQGLTTVAVAPVIDFAENELSAPWWWRTPSATEA
jgi:hypothetical protein